MNTVCPNCKASFSLSEQNKDVNVICPACKKQFIVKECEQISESAAEPEKVGFLTALKHYAKFSGRASRKEYWLFFVFLLIVDLCLSLSCCFYPELMLLNWLFSLAVIVPSIAVTVRRLHDLGCSGVRYLFVLIPFIGSWVMFYWMMLDSQPGPNRYGPNPKGNHRFDPLWHFKGWVGWTFGSISGALTFLFLAAMFAIFFITILMTGPSGNCCVRSFPAADVAVTEKNTK